MFFRFVLKKTIGFTICWLYGFKVFRVSLSLCFSRFFLEELSFVSWKQTNNYAFAINNCMWYDIFPLTKKNATFCLLKVAQATTDKVFPGSQYSAGGLQKPLDLWWSCFFCHALVCVQAEYYYWTYRNTSQFVYIWQGVNQSHPPPKATNKKNQQQQQQKEPTTTASMCVFSFYVSTFLLDLKG